MNLESPITEANPTGQAHIIAEIDQYIQSVLAKWAALKPPSSPWWKVWKMATTIHLEKATKFLLLCLDDLIIFIDDKLDSGPDKKATVLAAVDKLYDFIVAEAIPTWAKPFSGTIKKYIVYSIVSSAIDFIVDKYRNGAWRDKIGVPKDPAPATPA